MSEQRETRQHGSEIWARRRVTVDEARKAVAAVVSLPLAAVYAFDVDEEYAPPEETVAQVLVVQDGETPFASRLEVMVFRRERFWTMADTRAVGMALGVTVGTNIVEDGDFAVVVPGMEPVPVTLDMAEYARDRFVLSAESEAAVAGLGG